VGGVLGQQEAPNGVKVPLKIGDIVLSKESWCKGIAFQVISNDFQDVEYFDVDEVTGVDYSWFEEVTIPDRFICVMIGDDRHFSFDEDDLVVLSEDEYCGSCGQIGCEWH
jgi:hypothetical protein